MVRVLRVVLADELLLGDAHPVGVHATAMQRELRRVRDRYLGAPVLLRPRQHLQVPAVSSAAHVDASHGQSSSRARLGTGRCPC
jgi:hypothetical protein